MKKSNFHKSLMSSKKGSVTENKVINFVVVGAIVGISIPILYGFFADWATDVNMPTWLTTAGPAFVGIAVLIIIVGMVRTKN